MAQKYKNVGGIESSDALATVTDGDGAYVDYDTGGGNARFGAKGGAGANRGVLIRTLLAGVVVAALTFAPSGAASFAGALGVTAGMHVTGPYSTAVFRSDLLIDATAVNPLIGLFQTTNPGTTVNEAAIVYGGYTSTGAVAKTGSISSKWADATNATGFAVLRLNATYSTAGTFVDDVAVRVFGNNGVAIFGASDTVGPGLHVMSVGGMLLLNTGVLAAASAGDAIIPLDNYVRGVDQTGATTRKLIGLHYDTPTTSHQAMVGGGYAGNAFTNILGGAPIAAGAGSNGVIMVDTTTPGQFLFYAGNNRYKLVGTAF